MRVSGGVVHANGRESDSGSGVAQASGELDLGSLGRALWSKKGWIIGLTLAAAVIGVIASIW